MAEKGSSFVWYELMSADVAVAKAFYGKVVGWQLQDMPMPGMTYTLLLADNAQVGGMMALPQELRAAGMKPPWAGYIEVADCDSAAEKLQRLGGKVHMPPTDIPNIGRFAAVADPQGASFNLFKPQQSGERNVSTALGQVSWHELHAKDWAQAFNFYSEMFGWRRGDAVDVGPMGTYQIFTINGIAAGGMFNSPAVASPYWLMYFNVSDIDNGAKRIAEAGGKVMMGPQQVPGGTWIVQAADPEGTLFALSGHRKQ
jgi:predicted enzyme related to lactoylglutathione lyase